MPSLRYPFRVYARAAKDTNGKLWLEITNLDPNEPVEVEAGLAAITAKSASGETLTAPKVDSVNTFDAANTIIPRQISAEIQAGKLTLKLEPKSVTSSQSSSDATIFSAIATLKLTAGLSGSRRCGSHSMATMEKNMRRFAILIFLSLNFCWAQESGSFQPSTTNVWAAEYPRVDGAGRVQIRVKAPDATKVRLNFWSGPKVDMEKQQDGFLTVTTAPLVPGFHYYTLIIDGAEVSDPNTHAFFGGGKPASGVEVPEPGSTYYSAQDVPHGAVREVWYNSKVTGTWRHAWFICRPITIRKRTCAIQFSICNMAPGRTRPAGYVRATRTSSSTI